MTWLIVLAALTAWLLFDALVVWVLWRFGRAREACAMTSDAVRSDLYGTSDEWPGRQPMTSAGSGTPHAHPGRGRQSDWVWPVWKEDQR